jgi:cysteine-S-conjugate beta-lyase
MRSIPGFTDLDPAAVRARGGVKWARHGPEVLPLWVADMDFEVAPVIRRAVEVAVARSALMYPPESEHTGVAERFAARAAARWGWRPEPGLVDLVTDVVVGIEVCIDALTSAGDGVLVTTPVYPPFLRIVPERGRRLVELACPPDGSVDLDALAKVMAAERPRMVLLSSPHNPTGRVYRRAELEGIGALAAQHEAVVLSDEIHAELVLPGSPAHVPMALAAPEPSTVVTLTSASKPFNIAGLRCAVVSFASEELRERVHGRSETARHAVGGLGIVAHLAAWTPEGDEWLATCLEVLEANRARLVGWAAAQVPSVRLHPPEATYLAWLDLRDAHLGPDPAGVLLDEGRVALTAGHEFGEPGRGFARLNLATSPGILDEALARMADVLGAHR